MLLVENPNFTWKNYQKVIENHRKQHPESSLKLPPNTYKSKDKIARWFHAFRFVCKGRLNFIGSGHCTASRARTAARASAAARAICTSKARTSSRARTASRVRTARARPTSQARAAYRARDSSMARAASKARHSVSNSMFHCPRSFTDQ